MSILDQIKLIRDRLNSSSVEEREELRCAMEKVDPELAKGLAPLERWILGKPAFGGQ